MLFRRKSLEEKEEKFLAPYAVKSGKSRGRHHKDVPDNERLAFQRDKDRIVHCKAFRRLDEKTQVFMAGSGDHYRTRLTHTLEVAQISRDLARRLGLNEDLAESIALAHDLGHPPFGHGGEEALSNVMKPFGLYFEHNEQSRRVVEKLEKLYPNFDGLNLTFEVLEGMIKHQTAFDQAGKEFEVFSHLEAQIVNIGDEIAYTNHDMDDGIRSGIITVKQLRKFALWKQGEEIVGKHYGKKLDEDILVSRVVSAITSLMIDDLCRQTEKNLKKFKIGSLKDVAKHKGILASFSLEMLAMIKELRKFLYDNFYMHPDVYGFVLQGERMIKKLFEFYLKNPKEFPRKKFLEQEDDLVVEVKDYIAGMTDGFLMGEFQKYFGKSRR